MKRALILPLIATIAWAITARADQPAPPKVYVDPCIVTCPAGDSILTIVLRDQQDVPIANADLLLDPTLCPEVRFAAPVAGGYSFVNGCCASKFTNAFGRADFPLAAGGVCSGGPLKIYLFTIRLPQPQSSIIASFDQNGDLAVTQADLELVSGKIGTTDRTADFNCDSVVTSADYEIAVSHLGHVHPSVLGVGPGAGVEFGVWPAANPTAGATDFVLRSPSGGRAVLA